MKPDARRLAGGFASLLLLASTAAAEPRIEAAQPAPRQANSPAANPLGAKPLDGAVLARQRGGSDMFSEMKLKGVVADNHASQLTTGGNWITDGAFANANGVPVVVQNSGNNVLIQSATIVNVQLK